MARYFKTIVQTLENKIIEVDVSANGYSFRLTHAGTTCKIRGVKSKYANTDDANAYTELTGVEVGTSYQFEERYDAIEIMNANGIGNFVIEQEYITQ